MFEDAFLPDTALLGREGDGWNQVTSELAFERSGPERFLSSFRLFVELVRALGPDPSDAGAVAIGRLTRAHHHAAALVAVGRGHAATGRKSRRCKRRW